MEKEIQEIINIIEDKKGGDIKVYDMQGKTPFYDYSILATGSSVRNVSAIVQDLKKQIPNIKGVEGEEESNWVLIDTGDILISIFTKDAREYYELDKFYESI